MPGVARVGDPFTDGDHVATGSPDVFINNIPAARIGDATTGHPGPDGEPNFIDLPPWNHEVYINGIMVATYGCRNIPHPRHVGVLYGVGDVYAGS
jgi:uncharacterized Zn-binding protein involved in type VI secretion